MGIEKYISELEEYKKFLYDIDSDIKIDWKIICFSNEVMMNE